MTRVKTALRFALNQFLRPSAPVDLLQDLAWGATRTLVQLIGLLLPASTTPVERVRDKLAQILSSQAAARRWEEHVAELEGTLGLTVMLR
jgi:hypothetical protein